MYVKKSAKIYMVLLVWIAAALQFFINEKMDIEEVFAGVQEADAEMQIFADVNAWGIYGDTGYPEETIENILLNTAKYYGLSEGELTGSGQDVPIYTFQSQKESDLWEITFLSNFNTGRSYLVIHTDSVDAVDRIHTFYNDLNIDETMSVEADLFLPEDPSVSEADNTDGMLENVISKLPVTGVKRVADGWYGKLNSSIHLADLIPDKNVHIDGSNPDRIHLQFGDKSDLVRLYASILRR